MEYAEDIPPESVLRNFDKSVYPHRLAVVVGSPRSGTSVLGDLVSACGWTIKTNPKYKGRDIRNGRNEFPGLCVPLRSHEIREETQHLMLVKLGFMNCEGVKITYDFEFWIDFFCKKVEDVRLLLLYRNPVEIRQSRLEYKQRYSKPGEGWVEGHPECQIEYIASVQDGYLKSFACSPYRYIVVSFDQMLSGHSIIDIREFLNSNVDVSVLTDLIHPEVSLHKEKT